ncbi:flagellar basal body-associated FliL family protein [Paenibacillus crassostreae]|uniref:Flagellar protein FliL n=1 Tax=Paenibacillus crassostreae TaxID=1763538 RepID=A0A167FND8_9BACL|nr:flagellar basal body-associated FliL family protein [Paenibacillus crassostreae]AOZ94228.1 flagellar basal body protein FliL [Paenibacillus crassostreae]OAB76736.1 flagellar basal body protein FliL [Paenibacillus crassostreae]
MKKMMPWIITILLAITLIVLAAFLLMDNFLGNDKDDVSAAVNSVETKRLTADQIVELTSEIVDIKTNLAAPEYIVLMNFAFQLDSNTSKVEFDKIKEIKIKPIILKTLADTKPEDLQGANGKDQLSAKLINLINKTLTEGQLTQIEITNFILTTL